MGNFDLSNFIIDKVRTIYWYTLECPVCGYKNSTGGLMRFCPMCGEDLKIGEVNKIVELGD